MVAAYLLDLHHIPKYIFVDMIFQFLQFSQVCNPALTNEL